VTGTYASAGEPIARVPKAAREIILRGTRRTLEIKQIFVKIFFISLGIEQYISLRFQHRPIYFL